MATRARRPAKPKTAKAPKTPRKTAAPVRANDYEVLAAPLRELTRVSSVLATVSERLERASARIPGVPSEEPPRAAGSASRLHEVAALLDEVKRSLGTALGTLPREEDYRPAAQQLREVASVSPSLLEWLKEVPKLTAPLADSVAILREAAERLTTARATLAAAIEEIEGR